jgi:nucleotide-binding universal stress UspA family protein
MPLDTLLNAMEGYLNKEQALVAAHPDPDIRVKLENELDHATKDLQDELHRFAEARKVGEVIRRVLIAVDDSAPSESALDRGVRLAQELGARVVLVHVAPAATVTAPEFAYELTVAQPEVRQEGERLLQRLAAQVPAELIDSLVLREGYASRQIVDAAEEVGADLIVIGTHGRGMLGRFLLGSTAESVVRHAHCPVLTVGNHCRSGEAVAPGRREPALSA